MLLNIAEIAFSFALTSLFTKPERQIERECGLSPSRFTKLA